jgi:NADP-dependent 3-hydroxy acid dehydrogenase YdfG
MKIAFTGRPTYGVAEAWNKYTNYETDFFSRTNEWNFDKREHQREFAKFMVEQDYDVFVNSSALSKFNQTNLLKEVVEIWNEAGKGGRIICIGSTADRHNKATEWVYPTQKKALREYSASLSMKGIWDNWPVKVSYISFGSLQTKQVHAKHPDRTLMEMKRVVETIDYIINQPTDTLISEIRIDPIQEEKN